MNNQSDAVHPGHPGIFDGDGRRTAEVFPKGRDPDSRLPHKEHEAFAVAEISGFMYVPDVVPARK